jgi:hypothetical protein
MSKVITAFFAAALVFAVGSLTHAQAPNPAAAGVATQDASPEMAYGAAKKAKAKKAMKAKKATKAKKAKKRTAKRTKRATRPAAQQQDNWWGDWSWPGEEKGKKARR